MASLTKAQARQLEIVRVAGQVIETFNGKHTWYRTEAGLTSPVLATLVRKGWVQATGEKSETFATMTRYTITATGLEALNNNG